MYRKEECGCGGHGQHHGEQNAERQESRGENCGCGGHGSQGHPVQGMKLGSHHAGCTCGCHQQGGMEFHRRFISQDEIINRLEEYLKQLRDETKGVEEQIAGMKKGEEKQ